MAKATKATKATKKSKKPKAIPAQNLLIVGEDGKVVVATSTGKVTVVTDKALAAKLSELLAERQRAGKNLTEILKDAGFDVLAGAATTHYP